MMGLKVPNQSLLFLGYFNEEKLVSAQHHIRLRDFHILFFALFGAHFIGK